MSVDVTAYGLNGGKNPGVTSAKSSPFQVDGWSAGDAKTTASGD